MDAPNTLQKIFANVRKEIAASRSVLLTPCIFSCRGRVEMMTRSGRQIAGTSRIQKRLQSISCLSFDIILHAIMAALSPWEEEPIHKRTSLRHAETWFLTFFS